MNLDVGVFKSDPEAIPKEESPSSYGAIFQYGIVKQETKAAFAIKCEPSTLAAEKHVQEWSSYSEIDIDYPNIKKECISHLKRTKQSPGKKKKQIKIG